MLLAAVGSRRRADRDRASAGGRHRSGRRPLRVRSRRGGSRLASGARAASAQAPAAGCARAASVRRVSPARRRRGRRARRPTASRRPLARAPRARRAAARATAAAQPRARRGPPASRRARGAPSARRPRARRRSPRSPTASSGSSAEERSGEDRARSDSVTIATGRCGGFAWRANCRGICSARCRSRGWRRARASRSRRPARAAAAALRAPAPPDPGGRRVRGAVRAPLSDLERRRTAGQRSARLHRSWGRGWNRTPGCSSRRAASSRWNGTKSCRRANRRPASTSTRWRRRPTRPACCI